MTPLLQQAFSAHHFRQQGHALIDQLADYLQAAQDQALPTLPWCPPPQMLAHWQADAAQGPGGDPEHFFAEVLAQSIHIHHPQYMGHQVSGPAPLAALAELLAAVLNNGMAVYEMGQVSTALEKIVVRQLADALGYPPEADGILTSGGTLANLTAMLSARQVQAGPQANVWELGTAEPYAIMVSEEAHYCVERTARIMGWGAAGIVKVPVDARYRLRTDLLETYYQQARQQGRKVLAVVGSASSTSTGAYDDLEATAAFCRRHGLWFHVDGAHGGAAAYSPKYRHLVNGIAQADSVVVDFHKMLLTPGLVTALVFRNGTHSYQTFAQQAQYLWAQGNEEWFNLAKRTFECTKRMMSVKVYALMRTYGPALFADYVTQQYDLAQTLAQQIAQRPFLELTTPPMANIVCFRWVPPGLSGPVLSELNALIRQRMVEQGDFYLVQTQLKGETYLRVTLMNPATTPAHLTALLDQVETVGQQLAFAPSRPKPI
ncbi:MAG: aminotransferase class V-fold PLP-dependent enzyme [Bernardetiaceae bacterium]|jgi:L-2,4-diaminobutyrate decarboxylase|nr:aminotransferase class V-fold PLP-dependent enzyme [Bernardetiaceae bacterium]